MITIPLPTTKQCEIMSTTLIPSYYLESGKLQNTRLTWHLRSLGTFIPVMYVIEIIGGGRLITISSIVNSYFKQK